LSGNGVFGVMSIKRCRISKKQQLWLLELFIAEVTAGTAADLTRLHRNRAALYYHKLRTLIANKMAEAAPELGVFECDESYFGGVRKGKRGRGAAGKACVFGILKRGGKVHALPVADPGSRTLLTALKTPVLADSLVYTDSLSSYNFLDIAGFRHRRINNPKPCLQTRPPPQRHAEFLEPVQARAAQIQWHPTQTFLPVPQGMRVPFQYGALKRQLASLKTGLNSNLI
jgi:transposase